MGIFNFLKDVGQKLFDGHASEQAVQTPEQTQSLEQKLQQQIEKLNLGITNPKISLQGDKATIEGQATSQEALEKAVLALGNTLGIAQVESKVEAPATSQPSQFYTVQKGDTLSKISKEVYGDANRYNEIFKANQPLLKTADEIYPGQQLRIPQQEKKAA